jgi:hypothetical protein
MKLGQVNQPRDRFGRLGGQFQRVKVKNGGGIRVGCFYGQNPAIATKARVSQNSFSGGFFGWGNLCQPGQRGNQPPAVNSEFNVHRSALQQKEQETTGQRVRFNRCRGGTLGAAAGNGRTVTVKVHRSALQQKGETSPPLFRAGLTRQRQPKGGHRRGWAYNVPNRLQVYRQKYGRSIATNPATAPRNPKTAAQNSGEIAANVGDRPPVLW